MTALFIRRPVMTALVMIGILFFGAVSYTRLAVSDLPTVDFPTIQVNANLPGASPETMAAAVATPLEKQFSTIAGIDNMTSSSGLGSTSITIQFSLDRSINAAAQDVQAAISQTLRSLPLGILPPSYRKVNPADQPILYFALTSKTMPLSQLDEYGETFMAQRISMVPGIAQVQVYGGQKYAVRVQLDPTSLANRGIGIDEVASAIGSQNVSMPTGTLWGLNKASTIKANGQLQNAQQFRQMVVAYRNGAPVHLDEIGQVLDDVENNKVASWYNGDRAVVLAIQRQPGTNTVAVANGVKTLLASLREQIPPSVEVQTLYDRSISIEESVGDVKFTLMLTLFLVIMVIFVFLRNISATIIPSLALPMSLIGTFAVMYVLGFSLDNLSLMALTLAVGFVVDDAIVMIENIVRHIEEGKTPMEAALQGAGEIGFTILSISISLIAVFIPLFLMSGTVGLLFQEFAVTVAIAIVISVIVSLTLTPMMCARLLTAEGDRRPGLISRTLEGFFDGLVAVYDRALIMALRHRLITLMVMISTVAATLVLFEEIPKGFFPQQDTGLIVGITEGAQNISPQAMKERTQAVLEVVTKDPAVASANGYIGPGGSTVTENNGRMFITLKPLGQRTATADQVIARLNKALQPVWGITLYMQAAQDITIGARLSKTQYQYTLVDVESDELDHWAPILLQKLQKLPQLTDVASDQQTDGRVMKIEVNRQVASQLGINPSVVDSILYDAFGQRVAARLYTRLNQYFVILEVEPGFQLGPDALSRIYATSASGTQVPLSQFAMITSRVAPIAVNHQGQFPSVTLSFNLPPNTSIGAAVTAIQQATKDLHLPPSIATSFQGSAQAFQSSLSSTPILILAALIAVYIILAILYESTIHPITIISTLPSAGLGALLTLLLFGMPLDVIGIIGIILLIGIVKKNGIMLVDFALVGERERGLSTEEAIHEACLLRFRPILMTTMCALLGGVPLMLGTGIGSEIRQPLGYAIVGGLLVSQVLTLFTTPVVYIYMDRVGHWLGRRRRATHPEANAPVQ